MNHRQLGKDGADIPVLGLGAWPIGGGMGNMDDRDCIDTVRTAIDSGITLLDTAQAYRTSEATLGRALKDGYRERCFLATKVSRQYSRGDIENAIENSLRNLDVDYVDLYQIHSWNPQYPIEESMETMARLQEQGKTRFIGVSNKRVLVFWLIVPWGKGCSRANTRPAMFFRKTTSARIRLAFKAIFSPVISQWQMSYSPLPQIRT